MVKHRSRAWQKNNLREIQHTFGRFFAILAITALGVGFFAGLKVTKSAMLRMCDTYVSAHNMFDFHLVSSLGLTGEDVQAFAALDGIADAEGSNSADFMTQFSGRERVIRALSMPQAINTVNVCAGRLPQSSKECVADSRLFSEADLGSTLTLESQNAASFSEKEFTIVGICDSVLYMYPERGTGKLGGGAVDAFVYLLPEAFSSDCFTDIYITLKESGSVFSNEAKAAADSMHDSIASLLDTRTKLRQSILINAAGGEAVMDTVLDTETADTLRNPVSLVLERSSNTGYACFENDANIVEGVAKVFPLFFFLVAALVCITTMTRMVDEQRTQIGTLKALGYSNAKIILKYTAYSGTASLLGCTAGFFAGTKYFPLFIWKAYQMLYHFAQIRYVFDPLLAVMSLTVSLLCSVGATYFACQGELRRMPAPLMRPKSPKAGKRVLLERIPLLWNHLGFLRKVAVRNIFRYKKRLFMMLLGIGGCTALVLTGFGISDSISNIVGDQYDNITKYDFVLNFRSTQNEVQQDSFRQKADAYLKTCVFVCTDTLEVPCSSGNKAVNIVATDDPAITDLIGLSNRGEKLTYPKDNSALISDRLAESAGVKAGDLLTVRLSDTETVRVRISGVFENYVYNYLYMSADGYANVFSKQCVYETAYATAKGNDVYAVSAALINACGADSVSVMQDMRNKVDNMMTSLNDIVYLVIGCACALAFVVMYNLGNINITERVREIATIKVLGFYPTQVRQYVFRENIVLCAVGAFLGLPAGIALHSFVMSQIKIDLVSFKVRIAPLSYILALAVTFATALIVEWLLRGKINRIPMAESLKSVE